MMFFFKITTIPRYGSHKDKFAISKMQRQKMRRNFIQYHFKKTINTNYLNAPIDE